MRQTLHPILITTSVLLALPATALAAPGSVNDFRLPQGESQATPVPERQGPVAPDVPESQTTPTGAPGEGPGAVRTPAPAQPTGRPTPRPVITLPTPARSSAPAPIRPAHPATTPLEVPVSPPSPAPAAEPASPSAAPLSQPSPLPAPTVMAENGENSGWLPWLLGALALLLAAGLGWFLWGRKTNPLRQPATPVVERPRTAPLPAAAPEPAPVATVQPSEPLQVTLNPVRMSLTLVNAVLTWEAELANHGGAPLTGLTIAADMISAHADLSPEDRSSGPASGADSQSLGQLAPGELRVAKGDIRLPFPHIVPIWHGEIALLMPLLRLRIAADGIMPITRIFLVGQPSPTDVATLQPFRLDLGPRVYPDLAQRAFA